jgi:serine/threonine protein kinase
MDSSKFVQLQDAFEHESTRCLVTELLGSDLHDFVKITGFTHFREDQLRSIAYQLIDSVKCMCNLAVPQLTAGLHEHYNLHTDLKPENIVFVRDDVKLEVSTVWNVLLTE